MYEVIAHVPNGTLGKSKNFFDVGNVLGAIRTRNLCLRRATLYPIELRGPCFFDSIAVAYPSPP